eukprot:Opistho-1_new@81583
MQGLGDLEGEGEHEKRAGDKNCDRNSNGHSIVVFEVAVDLAVDVRDEHLCLLLALLEGGNDLAQRRVDVGRVVGERDDINDDPVETPPVLEERRHGNQSGRGAIDLVVPGRWSDAREVARPVVADGLEPLAQDCVVDGNRPVQLDRIHGNGVRGRCPDHVAFAIENGNVAIAAELRAHLLQEEPHVVQHDVGADDAHKHVVLEHHLDCGEADRRPAGEREHVRPPTLSVPFQRLEVPPADAGIVCLVLPVCQIVVHKRRCVVVVLVRSQRAGLANVALRGSVAQLHPIPPVRETLQPDKVARRSDCEVEVRHVPKLQEVRPHVVDRLVEIRLVELVASPRVRKQFVAELRPLRELPDGRTDARVDLQHHDAHEVVDRVSPLVQKHRVRIGRQQNERRADLLGAVALKRVGLGRARRGNGDDASTEYGHEDHEDTDNDRAHGHDRAADGVGCRNHVH